MEINLLLAIAEEHKQRTGHDALSQPTGISARLPTWMNCNVCLHLSAAKKKMENAERRHYEEMAAEAAMQVEPGPA